ncbi:putative solute carrier family 35 member E3 [Rosellinia necatrix]|uniref:GDP-mannose transporter n=1 Tax=Rosellinia necatrix TaxID=77044 RepID=A0A1W2TEI3_ROSNE|nr:putative solute carrier family 35 member E3 [Rosellinia necatrix]
MTFPHNHHGATTSAAPSRTQDDSENERSSSFDGMGSDRITSLNNAKNGSPRHQMEVEEGLLGEQMTEHRIPEPPSQAGLARASFWIAVNTLATIGIVFTNKAIFSDPSLKLAQLTFAAFHFFMTWLLLYTLSRPRFAYFVPRRTTIRQVIPLSIAMSLNVILPNLSLAYSSITFYQVARILLTPTVATMDFFLYHATLPRAAIMALVPACVGVGVVSYYDSLPASDTNVKTTSSVGVIFAFSGIFASSLYTVWIKSYQRKLQVSSMQLLLNQAPLSAFLLLYVIPFVDTLPTWSQVPFNRWLMILTSGMFAALINLSQFFIIGQTGPVSSTVVGHLKTCLIVALGWITSGRSVGDKSIVGVFVAVGGIISYSVVMLRYTARVSK